MSMTKEQRAVAHREANRKWQLANPNKVRQMRRDYANKDNELLKIAVMNVYTNGEQTCRHCGQGDIDVLCLDHINDDGAAHRKETAQGTRWQTAYKWIIKNDYPPNVQVLCYNCNMKKEVVRRRNSRKSNTLHA